MSYPAFLLKLLLLTLAVSGALFLLHSFPPFLSSYAISIIAVPAFAAYSLLIFTLSKRASRSDSLYSLTNIVIVAVLIKMMLCVAIVVAYVEVFSPTEKWFAMPLILTYIIYTIFEVIYMTNINVEQAMRVNKQL